MTRNECVSGPRPCPHVGCRYHLADLWGATKPENAPTCALDVAAEGEHDANELATLLGIHPMALARVEEQAVEHARGKLAVLARKAGY